MAITAIPKRTRWLGAGFVVAAVLFQVSLLGLPAVFLSVLLLLAYGLWIGGAWHVNSKLPMAFGLAILLFVGHAAEEYVTGFSVAFPTLFGRTGWSNGQYLVFNGVWLFTFCAAAVMLRSGHPFAVLIVLFFAVAGGVGNGLGHLLLALRRGAYFSGAWTAPLCLGVGIWLLRLLYVRERFATARK